MPTVTDKIPPQCLEMEQAVLGSMLIDEHAINAAMTMLTGAEFYRVAHIAIWKAIRRLWGRGEAVDLLTLTQELKAAELLDDVGGSPYLVQLMDAVGSVSNLGWYAERVKAAWRRRQLLSHAATCEKVAYDELRELSEVVRLAQDSLDEAVGTQVETDEITVRDTAERIAAEVASGPVVDIPTSLQCIDRWTLGLHRSEFNVLGGPTGGGKSSLALQIAAHVAENSGGVLFFSLEMSHSQIHERLLSRAAAVKLDRIRSRHLDPCEVEAIAEAAERIEGMPLKFCFETEITAPAVRAHARAKKTAPVLIVVDYLQLLIQDASNSVAELDQITRNMKLLAREMDVCVLTLAQYSRSVELNAKRPGLHNLRGSRQIEANADAVWLMSRADGGETAPGAQPERVIEVNLDIAKQRNGPANVRSELIFDGRYQRFGAKAPEGMMPSTVRGGDDDDKDPFR